MAIAIGTAIRSAISDVANVPQIRSSAPNLSVTAFHSVPVRNPTPELADGRPRLVDHLVHQQHHHQRQHQHGSHRE